MKTLFLFLLFFVFNLSTAHSFTFVERNTEVMLKNATEAYNKNFSDFSKAQVDQKFIKDFNSHKNNPKNVASWKAEVIGDAVYFKKDRGMFKIKVLEVKNSANFVMSINGKNFSFNAREGFQKNYQNLKSAMIVKSTSFWDIILPKANALDVTAPNEMEGQLRSALSWTTWAWAWFNDEADLQRERVCNLNAEEKNSYESSVSRDTLLSEIRFLITIQEKFVKPDFKDQKSGAECISTKCHDAMKFQTCIVEVAKRRKDAITVSGSNGFSCYEKFDPEYNFVFLNSSLLTTSYVENSESLESQIEDIETDRIGCQHKIHSNAIADCIKKQDKRLATLMATCPQDNKTFSTLQNAASQRARSNR